MAITIKNEVLRVRIREKGAELESIFHEANKLEYMWDANPKFWAKSSPVLFPVVGALKDDRYRLNGKDYSLSRHGFARDHVFELEEQLDNKVVFLLKSSSESKSKYPYDFELKISYEVSDDTLKTGYSVRNSGSDLLYFSIGGHPAFKVPLVAGLEYSDYFLKFSSVENSPRWTINSAGLIDSPEPLLENTAILPLTKDLFSRDALVFKNLKSNIISLRTQHNSHGLDFSFQGFPYFGIWAAPGADFVCLEPWCGIADSVNHNQDFTVKEGIQTLQPGSSWDRLWSVKCF